MLWSKMAPVEKLFFKWMEGGLKGTDVCHEYTFHPSRLWRFDFAWPSQKLAVEVNGFGYGHQAQQCQAQDNEKANAAVELGWRVLVYNSRQLGSHANVSECVEQICRCLCRAEEVDEQET